MVIADGHWGTNRGMLHMFADGEGVMVGGEVDLRRVSSELMR